MRALRIALACLSAVAAFFVGVLALAFVVLTAPRTPPNRSRERRSTPTRQYGATLFGLRPESGRRVLAAARGI